MSITCLLKKFSENRPKRTVLVQLASEVLSCNISSIGECTFWNPATERQCRQRSQTIDTETWVASRNRQGALAESTLFFILDVDEQYELIRSFMLAIAPAVTSYSLEIGPRRSRKREVVNSSD